ncbi:MAG: nuclease-related domain-containing protein, partial [Niallia sp.]
FILILECKHIAGDIYYHEETNQLWREYNGQRLILNDPFSQVMRHEEWMRQFLQNLKVDLPVYTAIVITTQSSSLNNMPRRFSIFKLPGLRLKIQQLLQNNPIRLNMNMLDLLRQELLNVFCNRKVQKIATKNTECCHPIFSLLSRQCIS